MNQTKIDSIMKDFRSTAMEGMTARDIAHRDDVKALAWDLNMWLRKTLEAEMSVIAPPSEGSGNG